ncbi:phage major capsid protein [Streptomyces sp. NBC_00378]|uniref:phage major capsid protein n=1 Tax=unclassified Streptomyces TaxID=2593676 RepID=UPI002252E097|nr:MULTISPECIES: phage major capsid protein [unclassified Streptomyces]MCX5112206.1 phage major capsid protein [Streptomyces sp. NBC_00378]MCX5114599.1 phage major capsid protein [Streptomyces sp. NBC_00378]
MTEYIKRLQERRANVWEQAKALLDTAEGEKRELTAEEEQTYQRLNGDLDAIDARAKDMADAEQRAADANAAFSKLLDKPAAPEARTSDDPSEQLRSWLTGKSGSRAFEVRPGADTPRDMRALSKLTPAAGGNTVPISFYNQLVQHMIETSGVLQTGPTVLRTASGEQMQIPKTTAHSASAGIVAEAGPLTNNEPTFGQVPLDAYKYGFLLQTSHELVNDTGVDLAGYLSMQAGRALGNGFGAHLVTGTGTNQPNGVLTAATLGVTGATTAAAGAFTADELIDLSYSVISPYRSSTSCGWLMRDATVAKVRKLKDQQGQYLWQPSIQVGAPDTLLGKSLYTDPNMPAVALGAKSVLFGDFSTYFVRQVETIRFERSDDFAFNTDLITYRAILRGDGDQVDTTGAIKYFAGNAA